MTFLRSILSRLRNIYHDIHEDTEDLLYTSVTATTKKATLLIIKIDSIGDYIIFRNFLKAIRECKKYSGYRITLLGNVWYKELAEEYDRNTVDEFMWLDIHQLKQQDYFDAAVREIFKKGFETAICPNYSMSAEDLKILARSGAREKVCPLGDTLNVSAEEKRRYMSDFTRIIDTGERYDFEFFRYRDFFTQLLEEQTGVEDVRLPAAVKEEPLIVICPGANSELRQWPPAGFAGLLRLIHAKYPDYTYALIGSSADARIAGAIVSLFPGSQIRNLCGQLSLSQLVDLIAGCSAMISNDTGPCHMAMALRKKTICISNGNNYARFMPYPESFQRPARIVLSRKVGKMIADPEGIKKFQTSYSYENIDEVEEGQVFRAFEELMHD